jgi:hypothetical protein
MRYPSVGLFGAALPVAAILSLVCGPSPSAAYAQTGTGRARAHPTKQVGEPARPTCDTAKPPGKTDNSPIARKVPAPSKPRKPGTSGAFVAPSSAKPSEGKVAQLAPTLAVGNGPVSGLEYLPGPVSTDRLAPRSNLHRATYLALAPPPA